MSASTSNASSISLILNQQISYAVYHLPAGTYHLPDDSGKLSQELLISLGLIERTSAPPTVPPPPPPPAPPSADAAEDDDSKSDSKKADTKARTRTVSKKMKDTFLASPGKTEDDLKRVSKAYKAATDADIAAAGGDFVSFGNRILAASAAPATPPAPKEAKTDKTKTKTVKPKVEKPKPRLAWSAAEKKVFKDIVTDVTDDLKAEFAAYIDAKSDDDFKAFAMAGHMRAWFDARVTITPKAGNGEFTPAEYDLARGVQNSGVQDDEDADGADEDEDLVDIDVDGEQLLIGTKTGTIYQPTEEAGDVKIGRAGEGKFKHVKIPQE